MAHKSKTLQLDLFSCPRNCGITSAPRWDTLPAQTRQTLASLIVRLLLDYVNDPVVEQREVRDDL